ncbi:MAG: hypothetical protein EBZ07_04740 [Verrucomicrobia bacterium]|nr:hypothetical protein [Verrucomicrobiota bacterium]
MSTLQPSAGGAPGEVAGGKTFLLKLVDKAFGDVGLEVLELLLFVVVIPLHHLAEGALGQAALFLLLSRGHGGGIHFHRDDVNLGRQLGGPSDVVHRGGLGLFDGFLLRQRRKG